MSIRQSGSHSARGGSRSARIFILRLAFAHEDKASRLRHLASNSEIFGVPVGLFFCLNRKLGRPQWADVGIYMQTVMLLAVEQGLDTCPQEWWARYPKTLANVLKLLKDHLIFAGMALGWRDEAHLINDLRIPRDPFDSWCQMSGF
jgi:nitroreductase